MRTTGPRALPQDPRAVSQALAAAEAGKVPPGEGGKFGPRVATKRHSGGEIYIFADGHVHWMMFRQTLHPQTGGTEGSMRIQPPLLLQYRLRGSAATPSSLLPLNLY